jgi:hypothetical protein
MTLPFDQAASNLELRRLTIPSVHRCGKPLNSRVVGHHPLWDLLDQIDADYGQPVTAHLLGGRAASTLLHPTACGRVGPQARGGPDVEASPSRWLDSPTAKVKTNASHKPTQRRHDLLDAGLMTPQCFLQELSGA